MGFIKRGSANSCGREVSLNKGLDDRLFLEHLIHQVSRNVRLGFTMIILSKNIQKLRFILNSVQYYLVKGG